MKKRPPPRTLEVRRKETVTPHMLRVTLGGPGLDGFPEDPDGGYVKLHLDNPAGDETKSVVRTYTVRRFDAGAGELDIDFVIHDSDGPAVNWAERCRPGDPIRVGGPGPKKPLDPAADWYLIAGDMSALPAISANIERINGTARGYALLEIIDDSDRTELAFPEQLQVDWIVNDDPETPNTRLLDAVKRIEWLPGRPYVWVAGEFSQSLAIRAYLKSEHDIDRSHLYASSYWQIGQTEDGHRVSKRQAQDRGT